MNAQTQFSETAEVDDPICGCHNCKQLYEASVEELQKVIVTPDNNYMLAWLEDVVRVLDVDLLDISITTRLEAVQLGAKLKRIKRIAALHAEAFADFANFGLANPFQGVAPFAANVVHYECTRAVEGHLVALLIADNPRLANIIQLRLSLTYPLLAPWLALGRKIGPKTANHLVHHIIYGNLLVFVEVYPIFVFCIKHFRACGVPKGGDIDTFETCLTDFRDWWRANNFGSMDAFAPTMKVDRAGFVVDGIIMCLRGEHKEGGISIATNEQDFTLQEYMYDKIDTSSITRINVPFDLDDPFYLATKVFGAVLKFHHDPGSDQIPDKYLLPFPWLGNVTVKEERMEYTRGVLNKFDGYYNGSDRDYLLAEHRKIRSHKNDK